jgi:hypothetical protein
VVNATGDLAEIELYATLRESAHWKRASWRISPSCRRISFRVPLETIGKTRVITTMVGGKIVYSAPP